MTFEKKNLNVGVDSATPMYQCKCTDATTSTLNFSTNQGNCSNRS